MVETAPPPCGRSVLLEKGTAQGGGKQLADDGKASSRWHELVSELAKPSLSQSKAQTAAQPASEPQSASQTSPSKTVDSDSQAVRSTLEKAVEAAKADSQWSSSGLPESLERTVQLCTSEGPGAAKTAALGLLDFHQIVKNTKLRSPKAQSPPVSPPREAQWPASSKEGQPVVGLSPATDNRQTTGSLRGNARLVTSGSHDQSKHSAGVPDAIGHSSPAAKASPAARIIVKEASHGRAATSNPQPQTRGPQTVAPAQSGMASEGSQAPKVGNGKEGISPIALQVATLMRDHLRTIQASGVLPSVSLELPAVPQLQLDSLAGPPLSSPVGLQPAASQHIAVINSCPLLVIPSTLPLPPEPPLYRPVRPNRTISAPSVESQVRPTQPIRCISAPSRLPAEGQPLRPGNVISSGVPQAHPRYREIGRLAPSPITKPSLPAQSATEVKVRVVHAPSRPLQDNKVDVEPVKRVASSPAVVLGSVAEDKPSKSVLDTRALSPLPTANNTSSGLQAFRGGPTKAERLFGPSLSANASPFARSHSTTADGDRKGNDRSPSPPDGPSPKRRKLSIQKVLSLNTVLRCVDAKDCNSSQDEALDAHVGEATTTVEDVTQLEPEAAPSIGRLPTIQSAPAQSSTSLSPTAALEHSKAPARNTPSPTSLHQMVRQVCEAVGETWRNSLQQHIQSSLTALGPPPQPLHSGPKPQSVGPSGLPAGTLSIYGGSGAAEHAGATSPGKLGEGATPDAAAAAVGRGFHLGDMPPCDDKGTTSKTALWSGKVKHKHGGSIVELFHMTALIPEQYLERLPPTLFASELANRSNVHLGRHYVMRCKLGFLSDRQLHKLHMLAHLKLVAICHLQHAIITLVPYYNAQNGFKVVGFMLADD
ncbi:hypothetical protein WJX84_001566 [Apatococcus fuscideae]|uniref:Uncharacterized protein n=1 Tax=Apatococcus fuscideae TaxID=2026836 RepID=A0AAW1TF92_9CHLO